MRTPLLIGIGAVIVAAGALAAILPHLTSGQDAPTVTLIPRTNVAHPEEPLAGLCPWRNPADDLKLFFPKANAYREETLILSGQRLEVGKRLGRTPTGEENALKMFRILHEQTPLGAVVTRRVRGESGVIEIVLAVGLDGKVAGAKVQRLREPDAVAQALQSPAWLRAFRGSTGASNWKLGGNIPDVPDLARASAEAILDGTRTALILFDIGIRASQGTNQNDPVRVP